MKTIKKIAQELLAISMQDNGNVDVFFDHSPHVQWIGVRVHVDADYSKVETQNTVLSEQLHLNNDDAVQKGEALIKVVKSIIKENRAKEAA